MSAYASVENEFLRLEYLTHTGPLTRLEPGDSVSLEEIWEVHTGEYATTPEEARIISRQLSSDEKDTVLNGK